LWKPGRIFREDSMADHGWRIVLRIDSLGGRETAGGRNPSKNRRSKRGVLRRVAGGEMEGATFAPTQKKGLVRPHLSLPEATGSRGAK